MIVKPNDIIDPLDMREAIRDVIKWEGLVQMGIFGTPVMDLDVAHRTTVSNRKRKEMYELSKATRRQAMVPCIRKEKLN